MLNATKINITAVHDEQELFVEILTDGDTVKLSLKPAAAQRLQEAISDGLRRLEQFKRTGEMEANRVY